MPDLKVDQVKVNRLQHCVSLLFSYQMNTGYVHSSGALILEPLGQQLVISVTKRGATQPITITSTTPAATVASELLYNLLLILYGEGINFCRVLCWNFMRFFVKFVDFSSVACENYCTKFVYNM